MTSLSYDGPIMRKAFLCFVGLLVLSGCETTQTRSRPTPFKNFKPIASGAQYVSYQEGHPFIISEQSHKVAIAPNLMKEGPPGQFILFIWNMGDSPITFGMENISTFDEYGMSLYVYSETDILNMIRQNARAKAKGIMGTAVVAPISTSTGPGGAFAEGYARGQAIRTHKRRTEELAGEIAQGIWEQELSKMLKKQTIYSGEKHSGTIYVNYPNTIPSKMVFEIELAGEKYEFSYQVDNRY